MYRIALSALMLAAVFSGGAYAEPLDARDLFRRVESLVQSLIGLPPADHGIIRPSGNTDPQMALAPPSGGTMRMIAPPGRFRQQ